MTPAEQLRATIALLESIQESTPGEKVMNQIINSLPELDVELNEGVASKALMGILTSALMSMAGAATIAPAQSNPTQDARCAGALGVMSKMFHHAGESDKSIETKELGHQLIDRAIQRSASLGIRDAGPELYQAANSEVKRLLQLQQDVKNSNDSAGLQRFNNELERCANLAKGGQFGTNSELQAKDQKARDDAASLKRAQQQSQANWDSKPQAERDAIKAKDNREFTIQNARRAGEMARSLMANGMAEQARAYMAPYNNGPEYARQAAWAAYNGR